MNEKPALALLDDLAGYALTCRRVNQREWMQGLAAKLSAVSLALGNTDTYRYDGRDFIVKVNIGVPSTSPVSKQEGGR